MRVTLTGATGLIGTTLVAALVGEGAEVTVLSRNPERAAARLGVPAVSWDPLSEPAPRQALEGRDAVVHLAGENVAQRWSARAKRTIRESRTIGTHHLVQGLSACATSAGETEGEGGGGGGGSGGDGQPGCEGAGGRPAVLVSASAIGYYGSHGEEPLDEEAPPGGDFLAQVCLAWETQARAAQALGMRTVQVRTGVVLDPRGGALAKMLPPFRIGIGGPVAGGRQYVSWIHVDDLVGVIRTALSDERWAGPVNGTAPEPVTNRELSHALGHALHRPALLPVPGAALGLLYGEMAQIVTTGARVLPAKPLMLGYEFRHPHLEEALGAALQRT
jgi:NAD dependent epimerase/dehydratase family enzyme